MAAEENLGYNRMLATPLRQAVTGARYLATRRGVLGLPAFDVLGFCKTEPGLERPDGMLLFAPLSITKDRPLLEAMPERLPGISCAGTMLRPDSLGSTHIGSSDPYANPLLDPGYLSTKHDRRASAGLARKMRALAASGPLASRRSRDVPGSGVRDRRTDRRPRADPR